MKYLKAYKLFEFDDDWRRKTDDESLLKLSLEIDDILYEISDAGFPYVQPSLIHNKSIMVEIVGDPDGKLDTNRPFEITDNIKGSLERISIVSDEYGYEAFIMINQYMVPKRILFKDNKWYRNGKSIDILKMEVDFITIRIKEK